MLHNVFHDALLIICRGQSSCKADRPGELGQRASNLLGEGKVPHSFSSCIILFYHLSQCFLFICIGVITSSAPYVIGPWGATIVAPETNVIPWTAAVMPRASRCLSTLSRPTPQTSDKQGQTPVLRSISRDQTAQAAPLHYLAPETSLKTGRRIYSNSS